MGSAGRASDALLVCAVNAESNRRIEAVYSRDRGRADAYAAKHAADHAYSFIASLHSGPTDPAQSSINR